MKFLIFDYICSIFNALFFAKYFSHKTNKDISTNTLFKTLILKFIITFFSSSYFITMFLNWILDLLLIYLLIDKNAKNVILYLLKYKFTHYMIFSIFFIIHTIILSDYKIALVSNYYYKYKNIIGNSLAYTFFTMYINSKKLTFNNRKYKYYFNTIIVISLFTLSYVTLYICKNVAPDNFIIPLIFTAIYILIAVMITMYDRFILILKENAQTKIALEKAMLEADYAKNIDLKLKELLSIRHDIKNHLNIIDGMLKHDGIEKVHHYIQKIQDDFSETYIIATPCNTISNILNYKYQICLSQKINFEYEGNFSKVYIDDYRLITILGNLIDNAITATSKLNELSRSIKISIIQIRNCLDITVINTHSENIKTFGNDFLSTKENHFTELGISFHGIGLKNVRSATKKLNGELDINYTDNLFCVSVTLPNYSKN